MEGSTQSYTLMHNLVQDTLDKVSQQCKCKNIALNQISFHAILFHFKFGYVKLESNSHIGRLKFKLLVPNVA